MVAIRALTLFALVSPIASQQIWDIWQTTWDRSKLFTSLQQSPINFGDSGDIGAAHIQINDGNVKQQMDGFGAALTDSSAKLLYNMKTLNSNNYWSLLNKLFNPTDGYNGAGMTVLRVPLGASDFSGTAYSFADKSGDTSLSTFSLDAAPSYLWTVLTDIQSINNILKLFFVPWSPPGWMKDSNNMRGGSLLPKYYDAFTLYLFKSVQALSARGFKTYALALQNEPQYSTNTYPSMALDASTEAQLGIKLRAMLDQGGFGSVKLIAYDHNWNNAGSYPTTVMDQAASAFAGASFHCYEGSVDQQQDFINQYPDKEVYFTECSGVYNTDWWSDLKWNMDDLFVGSTSRSARTVMLWNLALDPNGLPKLPGTASCADPDHPCRGVVTIDGANWSLNQEYYLIAHSSKAVIPRDPGGPFANVVDMNVVGTQFWALRAMVYVTRRANSADWDRYTIVALNWDDYTDGQWDPQPVDTTIAFRGKQARISLPVGITTFWFYAPHNSLQSGDSGKASLEASLKGGLKGAVKGAAAGQAKAKGGHGDGGELKIHFGDESEMGKAREKEFEELVFAGDGRKQVHFGREE